MKNLLLLSVPLLLLSFFFSSCKKKNNNPPEDNAKKYRLISEKFFASNGNQTTAGFFFEGDKLSRRKFHDGSYLFVTDFAYGDAKVYGEMRTYVDSSLMQTDKTEYVFEDSLLTEINSWKKEESNWFNTSRIEFDYDGENPVQYVETHVSNPYAKGIYKYEDNQLVSFAVYYYNDQWVKWIEDEYHYSGDTLKESYSTITTVGELKIKMVYHYQNGLLNRIDSFVYKFGEWDLTYLTDYAYDENENAILEEVRFAADSSVFHYTEYQYEVGESNLESIIYSGIPDDPELIYPKPLNNPANSQLLKKLYEGVLIN